MNADSTPSGCQPPWATCPPEDYYHLHPLLQFIIITQPVGWCTFFHTMEDQSLSRPGWLATYPDGSAARRWSSIVVLTSPDAEYLWTIMLPLSWSHTTTVDIGKMRDKVFQYVRVGNICIFCMTLDEQCRNCHSEWFDMSSCEYWWGHNEGRGGYQH